MCISYFLLPVCNAIYGASGDDFRHLFTLDEDQHKTLEAFLDSFCVRVYQYDCVALCNYCGNLPMPAQVNNSSRIVKISCKRLNEFTIIYKTLTYKFYCRY